MRFYISFKFIAETIFTLLNGNLSSHP